MNTRARGFTLIEVLVALAILAIVLAASLRASGMLVNGQTALRQRALANLSADNAMALMRLEPSRLQTAQDSLPCVQSDLDFTCTIRTGPTPNPALKRVEVQVVLADQPEHPLARRLAFLSILK